jgi:hypothetical protein
MEHIHVYMLGIMIDGEIRRSQEHEQKLNMHVGLNILTVRPTSTKLSRLGKVSCVDSERDARTSRYAQD